MNLEREQRARTLFLTASELPPAERDTFLDRECGEDELLRRCVDDLLRFSPTKVTIAMDPPPSGGPRYAPADCIGDYEIVQPLGEGGFGIVYLATQREPVTRQVAVKVMRSVRQGDTFIKAFEAERQTLAKMAHPGIAHFYDAGITEYDQPYFVMEYVPGIPITRFCDEHRLDIRQRLALMAEVCRAVQHAHTKQVIHRDLTPNNILVSMDEDGTPRPRIIDFGIAMGVDEDSSRIIGTPSYMSPEQATPDLDVDTRSDIYTLGAVLYELLVGQPPLTQEMLQNAQQQAVFKLVREAKIPDPSTRLSDVLDPGMVEARRVSQAALLRMLRRELDWIPRKAMKKNPEERYATASDLAADIDDFLDGRPITAAGQRRGYRFRKTLQRHKFAFAASLLVLLSLLGGVVATSLYAAEATRSADEATRERMRAEDNAEEAQQQRAKAEELNQSLQETVDEKEALIARLSEARAKAEQLNQSLQETVDEKEALIA
ncbi:MAG: serine/threonine protein kinase, partial [Phycisphaerae bacterium]|nr:serine/threonine protein kinase [Phycisphaerae bacterium]